MSKKLQLTIPKPCHENWDAMTPVQQGKFCGSCQKQVVDFSNMSDRQVAEFFKKPSTGSVCGRFMADQLERDIEIPKKRIPWLKYFFQFVIPAFLVSIKVTAQTTKGKIKVNTVTTDTTRRPLDMKVGMVARPICSKPLMGDIDITPVKKPVVDKTVKRDTVVMPEVVITAIQKTTQLNTPYNCPSSNNTSFQQFLNEYVSCCPIPIKHEPIDISKIRDLSTPSKVNLSNGLTGTVGMVSISRIEAKSLKGKVIDEKGNGLPGASIVLKGTRIGVSADNNSQFRIKAKIGDVLVISGPGLEPTEFIINSVDSIIIPVRRMVVGALVYIVKPKKEIINVPLIKETVVSPPENIFKIFPNPVESGNSLNIEIKQAEEGYYSLQLLNLSGQSVHQQEIWIDADARLLNIDIPSVAAGTYFLALINKKSGKRFPEKFIIQ